MRVKQKGSVFQQGHFFISNIILIHGPHNAIEVLLLEGKSTRFLLIMYLNLTLGQIHRRDTTAYLLIHRRISCRIYAADS